MSWKSSISVHCLCFLRANLLPSQEHLASCPHHPALKCPLKSHHDFAANSQAFVECLLSSPVFHLSENSPEPWLLRPSSVWTILQACSVSACCLFCFLSWLLSTPGFWIVRALQSSDLTTFSAFISLDTQIHYPESFDHPHIAFGRQKTKWFSDSSTQIIISHCSPRDALLNKTIPLFEKALVQQTPVYGIVTIC